MKMLVPIKRVIDYNLKVRVKADESDIDLSSTIMAMNPFCEIAVEEAVRLKESSVATEVAVASSLLTAVPGAGFDASPGFLFLAGS